MVIKGTVHNGQIKILNCELPEGTQVLITPMTSAVSNAIPESGDIGAFKAEVKRIADSPCENQSMDNFTGADHDKLLYGI
jgi:hypothetical protein